MSVRSLIAFTGGLDSTYLLQEELKKGHDVEVVYAYVSQGDIQCLAELTCRRRILNYFKQLYPGKIKDEWVTVDPALWVRQGLEAMRSGRFQLVQQYNTMTSLIQVILQADKDIHYRPMTGWHCMDVMENNPVEYQSEETYTLYKGIFKSLVRSVEPERNIFCGLTTPVWDVTKKEMWDSLDSWVQSNISTGYQFSETEERNGALTLRDNTAFKKAREYHELGISIPVAVTTHFELLSKLDRYFIGKMYGVGYGRSSVFRNCKDYYNSINNHIARAVNIEWMQRLHDTHRKSND
jgi:hypothetical protein